MVSSYHAYKSVDGIRFEMMCQGKPATKFKDDTKPTAHYDTSLQKYVIYNRRRHDGEKKSGGKYLRGIGRCVTSDLCTWESDGRPCEEVWSLAEEGSNPDVYTNAHLPYPDAENPSVHLFFPSVYYSFDDYSDKAPYGFGNDGLLDILLL